MADEKEENSSKECLGPGRASSLSLVSLELGGILDEQVDFIGMSRHSRLDPDVEILLSLKRGILIPSSLWDNLEATGEAKFASKFPWSSVLGDLQIPAGLRLGFTFPWEWPGIPSRTLLRRTFPLLRETSKSQRGKVVIPVDFP